MMIDDIGNKITASNLVVSVYFSFLHSEWSHMNQMQSANWRTTIHIEKEIDNTALNFFHSILFLFVIFSSFFFLLLFVLFFYSLFKLAIVNSLCVRMRIVAFYRFIQFHFDVCFLRVVVSLCDHSILILIYNWIIWCAWFGLLIRNKNWSQSSLSQNRTSAHTHNRWIRLTGNDFHFLYRMFERERDERTSSHETICSHWFLFYFIFFLITSKDKNVSRWMIDEWKTYEKPKK